MLVCEPSHKGLVKTLNKHSTGQKEWQIKANEWVEVEDQLQTAPLVPVDSLLRFYYSRKSFCVTTRDVFHPG